MEIKILPLSVQESLKTGSSIKSVPHCVTQLVLNCLDARATSVAVRVNLLTFRIQVVDNGTGIPRPNFELLGQPHATSKYLTVRQLSRVPCLFGQRGTALASIVKLAETVRITSRCTATPGTYTKRFEKGGAAEVSGAAPERATTGTTVDIEGFLYRMPVRRGRIKPPACLAAIAHALETMALLHPTVSFSLRHDPTGHVTFRTYKVTHVHQTCTQLYGRPFTRQLRTLQHTDGTYTVSGLASVSGHAHRRLQRVYVNRRPVAQGRVHGAIDTLLGRSTIGSGGGGDKRRHGAYIVNVKCARHTYDIVDLHDGVIEFADWEAVLGCVEHAVYQFLAEQGLLLAVEPCSQAYQAGTAIAERVPEVRTSQYDGVIRGVTVKRKQAAEEQEQEEEDVVKSGAQVESEAKQKKKKRQKRESASNSVVDLTSSTGKGVGGGAEVKPGADTKAAKVIVREIISRVQGARKPCNRPPPNTGSKRLLRALGSAKDTILDVFLKSTALFPTDEDLTKELAGQDTACVAGEGLHVDRDPLKGDRHCDTVRSAARRPEFTSKATQVSASLGWCPAVDRVPVLGPNQPEPADVQPGNQNAVSSGRTKFRIDLNVPPAKVAFGGRPTEQARKCGCRTRERRRRHQAALTARVNVRMESGWPSSAAHRTLTYERTVTRKFVRSTDFIRPVLLKFLPRPPPRFNARRVIHVNSMLQAKFVPRKHVTPARKGRVCSDRTRAVSRAVSGRTVPCKLPQTNNGFQGFAQRPTDREPCFKMPAMPSSRKPNLCYDNSFTASQSFDITFATLVPDNKEPPANVPGVLEFCTPQATGAVLRNEEQNDGAEHRIGTGSPFVPFQTPPPPLSSVQHIPKTPTHTFVPYTTDPNWNQSATRFPRDSECFTPHGRPHLSPTGFPRQPAETQGHISPYRRLAPCTEPIAMTPPTRSTLRSPRKRQFANQRIVSSTPLTGTGAADRMSFGSSWNNLSETQDDGVMSAGVVVSETPVSKMGHFACEFVTVGATQNANCSFKLRTSAGHSSNSNVDFNVRTEELYTSRNVLRTGARDSQNKERNSGCPEAKDSAGEGKTPVHEMDCNRKDDVSNTLILEPHTQDSQQVDSVGSEKYSQHPEQTFLLSPHHNNASEAAEDKEQTRKFEPGTLEIPVQPVKCLKNIGGVENSLADFGSVARSEPAHSVTVKNRKLDQNVMEMAKNVIGTCYNNVNQNAGNVSAVEDILLDLENIINASHPAETGISGKPVPSNTVMTPAEPTVHKAAEDFEITFAYDPAFNLEHACCASTGENDSLGCEQKCFNEQQLDQPTNEAANEVKNVSTIPPETEVAAEHKRGTSLGTCRRYTSANRPDFLPKGMSPILYDVSTAPIKTLSQNSKKLLHEIMAKNEHDTLQTAKWMKHFETKDANTFYSDLFPDNRHYEKAVPNLNAKVLPRKVAAGLTKFTFSKECFDSLQVIGQWDAKCIVTSVSLAANRRKLVLFDQHAVHERIRLEALLREYVDNETKRLKSTQCQAQIKLALDPFDLRALRNHRDTFRACGLQYSLKGTGTVTITHIPKCWADGAGGEKPNVSELVQGVIRELGDWLENGGQCSMPNVILDTIKREACTGAIKFGDVLSGETCEAYLKQLAACDLPFQCAHGRPTLVPIFNLNALRPVVQTRKIRWNSLRKHK